MGIRISNAYLLARGGTCRDQGFFQRATRMLPTHAELANLTFAERDLLLCYHPISPAIIHMNLNGDLGM